LPKQIELAPEVAKALVKNIKAFFAEKNAIKRDERNQYLATTGPPNL